MRANLQGDGNVYVHYVVRDTQQKEVSRHTLITIVTTGRTSAQLVEPPLKPRGKLYDHMK